MNTAFVLSGGGSLGAVQVGMLQALSEQGIHPDLLVGTSAGALNALWVAGHGMSLDSLAELARIWQQLRRRDIFPARPVQVVHALLGRSPAVSSSEPLGQLVREHCTIEDLADATIPVHLVATDLLNGMSVLISSGPPSEAIRASAAIPGIFAPIRLHDRWLVDGAFGAPSGVAHAVHLGATEVYVLPAGVPCALPQPPSSAVGVVLHALTLLIEQRLITDLATPPAGAAIRLIPPLCPVSVSAADFSQADQLIQRSHRTSARWLEEGGLDLPQPARFLSLHDHGHPPGVSSADVAPAAVTRTTVLVDPRAVGSSSMTAINVRLLNDDEWQLYRDVRLAALRDAPEAFVARFEDEVSCDDDFWRERMGRATRLVAERGSEQVGLVCLGLHNDDPQTGEVFGLWTAPSVRGQHVARDLVATARRAAADDDRRLLYFWVVSDNASAIGFAANVGFRPTSERRPVRFAVGEAGQDADEVAMVLPLLAGPTRTPNSYPE